MAKILLVDDSGLSRRTLRGILEPAGHTVTEAADGIAAIESYFLDRADVVLLDLTMTGMHGMEVLAKLRRMDSRVRVIVATADIQYSTKSMAMEGGASDFITKPFDPDEVLKAVESILAE